MPGKSEREVLMTGLDPADEGRPFQLWPEDVVEGFDPRGTIHDV
jgi:hypothetical protein